MDNKRVLGDLVKAYGRAVDRTQGKKNSQVSEDEVEKIVDRYFNSLPPEDRTAEKRAQALSFMEEAEHPLYESRDMAVPGTGSFIGMIGGSIGGAVLFGPFGFLGGLVVGAIGGGAALGALAQYFDGKVPIRELIDDYSGRLDRLDAGSLDAEISVPYLLLEVAQELPLDSPSQGKIAECLDSYYPDHQETAKVKALLTGGDEDR